jgi:hypothetical protein
MSIQLHKQFRSPKVNLLKIEHDCLADQRPEHLILLEKYQSRIKQLELEKNHLSKKVEECYDYIELQEYMAQKSSQKIQQLKKALHPSGKGAPVVVLSTAKLKIVMITALVLYAISVFV